jgi:hypothetical protein
MKDGLRRLCRRRGPINGPAEETADIIGEFVVERAWTGIEKQFLHEFGGTFGSSLGRAAPKVERLIREIIDDVAPDLTHPIQSRMTRQLALSAGKAEESLCPTVIKKGSRPGG